jgi:hypothetical protein
MVKIFNKIIIAFSLALLIISLGLGCKSKKDNVKIGGNCSYTNYNGVAEIINILKTEESAAQTKVNGGPGYEGYEIRFVYHTNEKIDESWALEAIKKEHLFQLANSWYPGIKYIDKYKIKTGNKYNCKLKIIKTGSCTPVIFEIENLDMADYF